MERVFGQTSPLYSAVVFFPEGDPWKILAIKILTTPLSEIVRKLSGYWRFFFENGGKSNDRKKTHIYLIEDKSILIMRNVIFNVFFLQMLICYLT